MLELQNVQYDVEENKEILKDINLKIEERFVAVTGPNGGGKSTLAKIIAGIVKPTAGRILLDGEGYLTAKTVRDRELAQVDVLHGLGWNILRIWTMDWWDNRQKELERVLACLEDRKSVV